MTRQRTLTLVTVAAVLLAAGGGAWAARSGDGDPAAAPRPAVSSAPPVRVVLPGRPGESARVTDSDQVRAPDGSTYNTIDVAFVQMMIVHHTQAVEMARLAPERAGGTGLRALAARMDAAQAPEINWLKQWLRARKLPESDPRHDHSTMPGMQTPAALAALTAARGAEFDHTFVTMMTAHHRGALRMAGDVLAGGTDQALHEVANEMAVEQGSEIRRMEQL
ncbi:DUF305 domain-containing protein [Actinoplanes sp. NPDC049599]|uniref:DUF305 domain-containing protein n=1 Tax=Actinoplanes sp. NPDC049599 TaxID=3363903 RepID=UPI0037AADFCC